MRRTFLFHQGMPTRNLSLMILGLSSLLLWVPCLSSLGLAQVPPITPSGLNTQVNLSGTPPAGKVQYDITGGTRPGGGGNLFHSFGEFGIPTNNIANFLNGVSFDLAGNPLASGLPTSNILGRVTGGNVSNILGVVQTTGFGNANLFLINPAGFLFGPNATVNVGGMVAFTSADYLKLTDNARFNAIPNAGADALLTASPVAAFGFLGSNPGAITVQGSQFTVTEGSGISLVGGNITIEAGTLGNGTAQPALLSAPAGRINLASVASPGEILVDTLAQAPNANGQSFGNLGTIQISEESVLDASGDGGGSVMIRGGRFVLDESLVLANVTGPAGGPPGAGIDIAVSQDAVIQNGALLDTSILGNATPDVQYGGVTVKANRIEILRSQGSPDTGIFSDVLGSTGGNSGDITLEANSILMKGTQTARPELEAVTEESAGSSGNIILRTTVNLEIDHGVIDAGSFDSLGDAGNVELTSTQGNIVMNRGQVFSQAIITDGKSGSITMSAPQGDILLTNLTQVSNRSDRSGGLGDIRITANNLTVQDTGIGGDNFDPVPPGSIEVTLSGSLTLSRTFFSSFINTVSRGAARAANLTITAHDISISGGSFLSTETRNVGAGGELNIFTENLQLTSGGQIRSGSLLGPINPVTRQPLIPSGAGGIINIEGLASPAGSIVIDGPGSGITTNAQGTGAGGTINLSTQLLTIQNGGTISASTSGTAPSATGGSVAISSVQSTTLNNGASVTAGSTGPANAGSIVINAGQTFTATNSSVTTQAAQASGGNITVLATDSVQLTNSQINASVQGAQTTIGGNIVIDPQFVILQNSQILAQATQGQGGNISITTGLLFADAISTIDASSQFGVNGNVTVQSPISQAGGKIQQLGKSPLQATSLLSQRCAALAGGEFSSFTVAGRDSLPAEPGGWIESPLAMLGAGTGPGARGGAKPLRDGRDEREWRGEGREGMTLGSALVGESAEEMPLLSLRQMAPPGFLTQAFAVDWSAGCTS